MAKYKVGDKVKLISYEALFMLKCSKRQWEKEGYELENRIHTISFYAGLERNMSGKEPMAFYQLENCNYLIREDNLQAGDGVN